MLTDPYLIFVKCFATWFRIRVLMGFIIAWCIIIMSLSAWEFNSDGGDFSSLTFSSGRSYSNWDSDVCQTIPYLYLSPFSFSYSLPDGTSSSSNTYCSWSNSNSELRVIITVLAIVHLAILYIKTPISLIARPCFAIYALAFFAAFVIDASATTTGQNFCKNKFMNTNLYTDISSLDMSITCSTTNFEVITMFDIIASILFFILHTAWKLTKDLYVYPKKDNDDQKALLSKKASKK